MIWIRIFFLSVLIGSCGPGSAPADTTVSRQGILLAPSDLQQMTSLDTVKILDLQHPDDYGVGHIAGAINLWRSEIQNDSFPYKGMIGRREHLEAVMRAKGINDGDFLVLYDDRSSCEAARLWWVLDHYGFDQVAILDGGIQKWQEQYPVSQEIPEYAEGSFALPTASSTMRLATIKDLKEDQGNARVLLDARSVEEYRGQVQKAGASGQGRIPGSRHLEWIQAVNADHTFKSREELETMMRAKGLSGDEDIVVYCHSGVRSAHLLFVLSELLGYQNVKNYDGSWVEWTWHDLPVETDEQRL